MTILRGTDCFILIWTCSAVLTEPHNFHFQIVPASKRNPHKNQNVVLSCCHVVLENDAVKLHGRSHPAHNNAARMVYHTDHRPCGCQGIKELKGPSRGHGLKDLDRQRFSKSPSPGASGFAGIQGQL